MMRIWYRKKVVVSVVSIIVTYLSFRCRKYSVEYSAAISNAQPVELWEYVSDFSNMQKLNPTIVNFAIESESGNYNHWKYSVHYTEHLSQFPSLTNFALANFEIKILPQNTYAIYSNHTTCFFTSFTCVSTESTFFVEPTTNPSECKYTEYITYECPAIFSSFCKREVFYQRTKIRDNLRRVFKKNVIGV